MQIVDLFCPLLPALHFSASGGEANSLKPIASGPLGRAASPELAVTQLPGLLVARYLGDSSEAALRAFTALWKVLRPSVVGRAAVEPRIWRT